MATYNGAAHLEEQLQSISDQVYTNWDLWVSDDGSNDRTMDILAAFQARLGRKRLRILDGPKRGPSANFLSLLCRPDLPESLVALCDQDDVWLPHKLGRAVAKLDSLSADRPALYGCRTVETDAVGGRQRKSRLWKRPPSLRNALVQNIIGGHGAVLNATAVKLLGEFGADVVVPYHDWWVYLVVSACGGEVFFDTEPGLLYRQHHGNVLGANRALPAMLQRLRWMREGRVADWNNQNLAALMSQPQLLTVENRALLREYSEIRGRYGLSALRILRKTGIYRQDLGGSLAVFWATARGNLLSREP
jgi:glycosyltransferase involved in cell wall biosynthesis